MSGTSDSMIAIGTEILQTVCSVSTNNVHHAPMPRAGMYASRSRFNPKYDGLNKVWQTRPSSIAPYANGEQNDGRPSLAGSAGDLADKQCASAVHWGHDEPDRQRVDRNVAQQKFPHQRR